MTECSSQGPVLTLSGQTKHALAISADPVFIVEDRNDMFGERFAMFGRGRREKPRHLMNFEGETESYRHIFSIGRISIPIQGLEFCHRPGNL